MPHSDERPVMAEEREQESERRRRMDPGARQRARAARRQGEPDPWVAVGEADLPVPELRAAVRSEVEKALAAREPEGKRRSKGERAVRRKRGGR